jgi:hypothetical protein
MNMIVENYETMDHSTRKNLLINLQESTSNLYKLLKSLLEWSMSQSEKITIDAKTFSLNTEYKNIFSLLEKNAVTVGVKSHYNQKMSFTTITPFAKSAYRIMERALKRNALVQSSKLTKGTYL